MRRIGVNLIIIGKSFFYFGEHICEVTNRYNMLDGMAHANAVGDLINIQYERNGVSSVSGHQIYRLK